MNNVVAQLLILAALGLAAPAASAGKSISIDNNTGTALRELAEELVDRAGSFDFLIQTIDRAKD